MGKIRHFDVKSQKNRIRVARCRQLKKMRSIHDNSVRERVFSKTDDLVERHFPDDNQKRINENNEISDDFGDMNEFESKLKWWATNHRISAKSNK